MGIKMKSKMYGIRILLCVYEFLSSRLNRTPVPENLLLLISNVYGVGESKNPAV
jgi:hypothetical protein